MTDVSERIQCRWCRGQSPAGATTCERCGAPLDTRDLVTDSGWRQAPQIRDLTEVRAGASTYQLDGSVVPVAEVDLGAGDTVYFEHHVMLWKDFGVSMSVMDTTGRAKRILAGMPFVLSVARGPGRLAFSRDGTGELVILPIEPGDEVDVREHAMLVASGNLSYSYERVQGIKTMLAAGTGMYLDRYVAQGSTGLLILHGYGNVLQRTLGEGETVQVEPGAFLYKDAKVTFDLSTTPLKPPDGDQGLQAAKGLASRGFSALKSARQLAKSGDGLGGLLSGGGLQTAAGVLTGPGYTLMRFTGPGRVGIQSMSHHHGAA